MNFNGEVDWIMLLISFFILIIFLGAISPILSFSESNTFYPNGVPTSLGAMNIVIFFTPIALLIGGLFYIRRRIFSAI